MQQQLKARLTSLDIPIKETIEKIWSKSEFTDYILALVEGIELVSIKITEVGDSAWGELQSTLNDSTKNSTLLPFYVVHFLWADRAKQFLILWRDVIFQQQKALVVWNGGQVSESDIWLLKTQSRETIQAAFNSLKTFFDKELTRIKGPKDGIDRQINQWKLQANPWQTYKQQIAALPKQGRELSKQSSELIKAEANFEEIREHLSQTIFLCEKEIQEIKDKANTSIEYIVENVSEKAGKIVHYVEDVEQGIIHPEHHKNFNSGLELRTESLIKKIRVYVSTNAGLLQFKDVYLQKQVRQWLDSEILPLLYEVWELTEEISNGMKMSLLNIRNRAVLLSNEQKEGKQDSLEGADIRQPLTAFLKKMESKEEELHKLKGQMEERLEVMFHITKIFGQNDFLPIALQSTINNLKINQNEWYSNVKNWFQRQRGNVRELKTSIEQEKALSVSEKIVRFVQSRTPDFDNQQYSSIFLTKGYIGESFWVGRERELQHMTSLIEQWRLGFRGAVLLSGQRFSGKSLFGELITNQFASEDIVRLQPNTLIRLKGRKFTTKDDIEEALEFIKNYTINSSTLVWIDDLELWSSPTVSLSQNVRILKKYIDGYSGRIFFLVSMSNWLKAYLDKMYKIEHLFQAEINLDKMKLEDIQQAILIRHGATHKVLVNEEGEELQSKQFKKITARIYKNSEGNIGDALNQWSFATKKMDAERVICDFSADYSLPDFLNPHTAVLLAAIMIDKRTNEYRLRKSFGPAFNTKYRGVLQRLISVRILTRHLDGWLELNEAIVNDVGRLLEENGYLKFYH